MLTSSTAFASHRRPLQNFQKVDRAKDIINPTCFKIKHPPLVLPQSRISVLLCLCAKAEELPTVRAVELVQGEKVKKK